MRYSKSPRARLAAAVLLTAVTSQANPNVYVTRFWHNHQPIYWPEWNANGPQTQRVQYAWDSIVLKPSQYYGTSTQHPENDLVQIFNLDDRKAAYQGRPRDSLANITPAGGFALSYSGSLIDNVRNLAAAGQLGYGSGWWDGNRQARSWTTPSGSRRLDLVGFTYHHSLAPLLPKAVLRKEIQIFKQAWWKAWNGNPNLSDHSKGFFPTEMAFSRHIVDVLVDEGYEWVIVASHHLSRTCPTYFNYANPTGTYNIYSSPPNKADLLGPSPTTGWWYAEPNPGNAAWNVAPFAYQLHRVKYVNPATGQEKSMIVVPSDDVLSYRYGYANEGISKIQTYIAPFATSSSRPVIVMPATDGDNAWGGGYSSWMEATPQFFSSSASAGYRPTTVQDFVNQHGAAAQPAHVEDGAWIFPEMCYGSPYFLKWIEPPVNANNLAACYPGTQIDLETPGFALKFWSWSPVMAGANWCETAEQLLADQGTNVQPWKIQCIYDWDGSYTHPNIVERAWHIYLAGLDSGFNYYGGLGNDDEVKQALATERAISLLRSYVTERLSQDRTPPTVLKPQRFPYNPGAYTFGWFNSLPNDNRFLKKMGSDFYIWTLAYDVSGIASIAVKVRLDLDGTNSMANNHNETYAGGSDVGPWITVPMTKRTLPKTRSELNAAANNSQIDYFITCSEIADYYFAKITQSTVPNFRGKLLDYYIEAVDNRGNTNRTDIQHVFVEDDGAGVARPFVTFSSDPRDCAPLVVTYSSSGGVLQGVSPVFQQISFNGGTNWTRFQMSSVGGGVWVYTNTVPDNAPGAWVKFENSTGSLVDNNGGLNWFTTIRDCEAPSGPGTATTDPLNPSGCGPVRILYYPNAGVLQNASAVYIHIGRNGWQDIILPNPAMTRSNANLWVYTYYPPPGTWQIDVVFNNGAGVWDNRNGQDWHFSVANCPDVPPGLVITNPPSPLVVVTTSVITISGTAGSELVGHLRWTNSLTGASGSIVKSNLWSIAGIALAHGTNAISVSGTNQGAQAVTTNAADAASYPAYASGVWTNGQNSGVGFGGWVLYRTTNDPNRAGFFIAVDSPRCQIGSRAWGLYANNGEMAEVKRPFSTPLTTGDTFFIRMDNGYIDPGRGIGVALQNAAGQTLWQFFFNGGDTNYSMTGRSTDIGWTSAGLDVAVTLVGPTTFVARILPYGSSQRTYTGHLESASSPTIAQFRAWNYSAGPGSDYDFFVTDARVTRTTFAGGGASTTATVRVVYSADANNDGLPDTWQAQYWGTANHPDAAPQADPDGDGHTNAQEYRLGTNPTQRDSALMVMPKPIMTDDYVRIEWVSVGGRTYSLQFSTNLLAENGGFVQFLQVQETAPDGVLTNRSATHNLPLSPNGARFYRIQLLAP